MQLQTSSSRTFLDFLKTILRATSLAILTLTASDTFAALTAYDWFPEQKLPQGIIRTTELSEWPQSASSLRVTLASAAGLAAKAVNEGSSDEMLWVSTGNTNYERWGNMFFSEHPKIKVRAVLGPWEVVSRLAKQGIVKGYILYRKQPSDNDMNGKIDESINVATSMAGILDGVVVEASLEGEAEKLGLAMLLDARDKTPQWCFDNYRDKFNRHMLAILGSDLIGPRDYVIAHKTFTLCETGATLTAVMKWVEPPAPVLGWIRGDEFKATSQATEYGLFQTASSLVPNMTILSAGARDAKIPHVPKLDPHKIDWSDKRSTVSFLTSDGDNVSFATSTFFGDQNHNYYWSNPERGKIPFGWSFPAAHLAQLCPQALKYAVQTETTNDWLVEWHGGYYYPDLFATKRTNRWELLGEQAARTWELMQKSGEHIIGFNIRYLDRPDAKKAFQTIAANTDGVLGILAFQYSPYNAGAGEVFWVKDKRGIDIPVVTLRYQIWWQMAKRANAGTPAKVARFITDSVKTASPEVLPRNDWAMVHVWSYFKMVSGTNELAEELPRKQDLKAGEKYEGWGGVRGYSPALWCAERLPESIRAVSPDEMLWRVRMKHNPEQTKKLIAEFHP
jgi:hypothetical protein